MALFDDSDSPSNLTEYSVSELSGSIKRTVETAFDQVRLRGEISGYRGPHSSGHAYFSLKDDRARIDAVIWKMNFVRLKMRPEEGMEVIATGKVSTFPGSSKYQIIIDTLEPAGVGALMAMLEERRKRLAAEGLFDQATKKPLPFLPRVIGVVTSPTGAVIRDILHRIADRFPVHVIVWPVKVQGEGSGDEVAAAIDGFNQLDPDLGIARPDLLIVARGGGSLEDLWGFNDEAVVRAAARSTIPLISAVGHETDWTLIDHAADMRAPTPTGAAEMAVPVKADLEAQLAGLSARHHAAMRRLMEARRQDVKALSRALPQLDQIFAGPRRRFDEAATALAHALALMSLNKRRQFEQASVHLRPDLLRRRLTDGRGKIDSLQSNMARSVDRKLEQVRLPLLRHGTRLDAAPQRLAEQLAQFRLWLDRATASTDKAMERLTERRRTALAATHRMLSSLSYTSVLERGFAVVRDSEGKPLPRQAGILRGAVLAIEFADGRLSAVAGEAGDAPPPPAGVSATQPVAPAAKRKTAARADGKPPSGQGSLF